MPKELFSWCMKTSLGVRDCWRLVGHLKGNYSTETGEYGETMPSPPVSLETTDDGHLVTTKSGNQYLLTFCRYPEREAEYLSDIRAAILDGCWLSI